MSGRKVASLTSSLLARKGGARPAGTDDASQAAPPSPETATMVEAAQSPRETVRGAASAQSELRPYAWPTQGPPSDETLSMPPPPENPGAAEPAGDGRPPRRLLRRIALVAAAAVVVAAATLLLFDSASDDTNQQATKGASYHVVAVLPPPAPAQADSAGGADAAQSLREVAPAAGGSTSPLHGDSVPSLAPAPSAPPLPAVPQIAVLPPDAGSEAPLSAAELAPPPIERPAEQTAPPAPAESAPPAPRVVEPVQRASAPPTKPAAAAPYAVQIASIGSRPRAEAESTRLAKVLGDILGGRKPAVEEAEVAGRGTMYRIRVGGYASKAAADRTCAAIKKKRLDCLVVRR